MARDKKEPIQYEMHQEKSLNFITERIKSYHGEITKEIIF
jgi:hypothetical protein